MHKSLLNTEGLAGSTCTAGGGELEEQWLLCGLPRDLGIPRHVLSPSWILVCNWSDICTSVGNAQTLQRSVRLWQPPCRYPCSACLCYDGWPGEFTTLQKLDFQAPARFLLPLLFGVCGSLAPPLPRPLQKNWSTWLARIAPGAVCACAGVYPGLPTCPSPCRRPPPAPPCPCCCLLSTQQAGGSLGVPPSPESLSWQNITCTLLAPAAGS